MDSRMIKYLHEKHGFTYRQKLVNFYTNRQNRFGLVLLTLLQNTFVVSAGKVSLVSALQTDTIYTIRKRRSF
jgi:hypothetical protein